MADPHFDHDNVLKMSARPFTDVQQMGEEIIHQINKAVGTRDTLYMLGDICWKANFEKWRKQIKCKDLHLIWGNHDRPSFAKSFKRATDVRMIKLTGDNPCFLSHYAHAYWPKSHRGAYHAYGHTHHQREETLDKLFPERRSRDVGVDSAYEVFGVFKPFSEHEFLETLKNRKGHDDLEFYADYQEKLHRRRNVRTS